MTTHMGIMKSPIALLTRLLVDIEDGLPGVAGLDRDLSYIKVRVENEGYGFLTKIMPQFHDHVLLGVTRGVLTTFPGFKTHGRKGPLPAFLRGLVSRIFDSVTGRLLPSSREQAQAFRMVRQVCYLFKKVLVDSNEKTLDLQAKEKFYACEDRLSHFNQVAGRLRFDIALVSSCILRALRDFSHDELIGHGRHGPGSIIEGVHGNGKWHLLAGYIRSGFNLFPGDAADLLFINESPSILECPSTEAKLISVPKNTTSRRTITVEPLLQQFYQQSLNRSLRRAIEICPILKMCLALNDQSVNANLALTSSVSGEKATIDLSSASDLLSVGLVEAVFQHHGEFLRCCLESRSTLKGADLLKYAGMGNATTFPVQSVVFAVLSVIATLRSKNLKFSTKNIVACARSVSVYGDDIVIEVGAVHCLREILEEVGLVMNVGKSFFEGPFRESCGIDAFNGVNVTPVYIRQDLTKPLRTDADVETLVSTANQLNEAGFYRARDYIKSLVDVPIRGGSAKGGITWVWLPNHSSRWNGKLHRREQLVHVSVPRLVKDPIDGTPALLKYFLTPLIERQKGHLDRSPKRYTNKLRLRWMPY